MLVIVSENIPPRLRGRFGVYMIEIRPGVFVGDLSRRVREMLWKFVKEYSEDGSVVMVWTTNSESGYDFLTWGKNRRELIDYDGLKLVSFKPLQNQG